MQKVTNDQVKLAESRLPSANFTVDPARLHEFRSRIAEALKHDAPLTFDSLLGDIPRDSRFAAAAREIAVTGNSSYLEKASLSQFSEAELTALAVLQYPGQGGK